MRRDLPTGLVTLVFTDVEGSTALLHALGPEGYAVALTDHRRALREQFGRFGGVEVDTQGDAFFFAFPDAASAVAAASAGQAALARGPIRVRIGIHTGSPHLTAEGYIGEDVHLGARIAAVGHGGQVLVSAATRELVEVELCALGEHRLKDFARPVAIFQLGADPFPPLRTVANTNLPRPASSFIGRDREVADLVGLLRGGARLVTLTGPGGSGKTRLALEAAAELVGEPKAGIFWVGLATIVDPALVLDAAGQALGVKDDLADWIGERELILLLDNLEQVIAAAPRLADLIEACPNLRLVVTSRELLRVRGEVEYRVLPLADAEAVALFAERARVDADETVAELCRQLDNLPLALELAAARVAVLTPEQILERLSGRLDLLKGGRDADPRQRTLRTTIAWSYELLDGDERRHFARLAVFRGGCTLTAAERVLDADLDVLQSLVDKSLLRRAGERFWMLETIREFAGEHLDDPDCHDRHAAYYVGLAEDAFPHLTGSPKHWLDLLAAEHDNLRAVLDHLETVADTEHALQLAGALSRFWIMRGHFREAAVRLERLLAADPRPTAGRARALNGAAAAALNLRDPVTAAARTGEAFALHRQLGDTWGAAYSLFLQALGATEEGRFAEALPLFERCAEEFRALGDDHYALVAADGVAWSAGSLGDPERRRRGHENVLRDARAQGDWAIAAAQLEQLSRFAMDEGRTDDALAMLAEALQMKCDLELPATILESLVRFADTLAVAGRPADAARLLGAAETLQTALGGGGFTWVAEVNAATHRTLERLLAPAALDAATTEGRRLTLDDAVALAIRSAGRLP